jgi:hypothetical protein
MRLSIPAITQVSTANSGAAQNDNCYSSRYGRTARVKEQQQFGYRSLGQNTSGAAINTESRQMLEQYDSAA